MNLYLLTTDWQGYDTIDGFVIAASGEHEARVVASENHADEGFEIWLEEADCEHVGTTDRDAGIVLRAFNAG